LTDETDGEYQFVRENSRQIARKHYKHGPHSEYKGSGIQTNEAQDW
jgi:hypothetical protein